MNLYNLLVDDFCSVEIKNKAFYKKNPNSWMSIELYEELEKELNMTSEETSCIIEEYINGLAGATSFGIVNKEGLIIRGKLLVMS